MTKTEYMAARGRAQSALDHDERLNLTGCVVVNPQDLRLILAGPPVSREDVARVIATAMTTEPYAGLGGNTPLTDAADAIQTLYRGERP